MRRLLIPLLVVAASAPVASDPVPAGAIQVPGGEVNWSPGPPSMPAGTRVVVLEGDPKAGGMFTQRMQVPAGARIAPHWHPRPERVTVLSGTVAVGFGETVDEARVKRFGPGSFYVNPPQSRHYVLFLEDAVVQITGEGPWELHYVK
jgi:quercetin dioxygenase-like cupin family protein